MKTKSPYSLGIIIVFSTAAIAFAALNAYAQNATTPTQTLTPQPALNQTADPQQIKNYLNQAIEALDSGNNTKALEQVDLAEDQLESMIGTEDTQEDDEDEDEEGGIEEGAGEDEDEPGDVDINDEEDTP
jgi:hypothetical protein